MNLIKLLMAVQLVRTGSDGIDAHRESPGISGQRIRMEVDPEIGRLGANGRRSGRTAVTTQFGRRRQVTVQNA